MRSLASRLSALCLVLVATVAEAYEPPPPATKPVEAQAPVVGLPPVPPVVGLPPVPRPPPAIFASQREDRGDKPLSAIHGGHWFVRDPEDVIRIYPSARLRSDFHYAPGAPGLPATLGEDPPNPFGPSLYLRGVAFEVSGELFSRLAFTVGVELGGGRIGNTEFTGPDTPRLAMASAHDGKLTPTEVTVSYRFRRWLNATAGQQLLPFSASNRTREESLELFERPLAVRAFAVAWQRDIGLTFWGEAAPRQLIHYEIGIFSGDGYEHPFADVTPDFAGRITSRPLAALMKGSPLEKAELGVSARVGGRDFQRVTYDYPTIATNQGWVLWQPGYVDSLGRVTHVLPSGLQRAFGGELRVPIGLGGGRALDLQAETFYVENNTREAVAGTVTTNTERYGTVKGLGWYAQIALWCCGEPFANGEVGAAGPRHLDLDRPAAIKRGLELVAVASGINGSYAGSARLDSPDDPKTPRSNISVYQLGGGAQYWFGTNFRGGLHYMAYLAPKSGEASNLVVMPGNVADRDGAISGRHSHHELTLRLAAGF